jgi:hypothetical protein
MSEDLLQRIPKKVRGRPAWNVKPGCGSGITLQFGQPELTKNVFWPTKKSRRRHPYRLVIVKGEWGLWIYCCDWVIRQDGRKIGDPTSKDRIDRGSVVLDGQRPMKVAVNPTNMQTDFYFDLGGQLRTTPHEGEPLEMGPCAVGTAAGLRCGQTASSRIPAGTRLPTSRCGDSSRPQPSHESFEGESEPRRGAGD